MKQATMVFRNIAFEKAQDKAVIINDYFELIDGKRGLTLLANIPDKNVFESNPTIFLNALMCALPNALISPHCIKSTDEYYRNLWKTNILFSYYGCTQYEPKQRYLLSEAHLSHIREWHHKLIEYNKACSEDSSLRATVWNIAYNEYLSACTCSMVENGYMSLITALEALLVEEAYELSFRVSLYAATALGKTEVEREHIFNIVKAAYNLRSKAVHGDAKSLKKLLKKNELYIDFLELKAYVSELLILTYGKTQDSIKHSINTALYRCPPILL